MNAAGLHQGSQGDLRRVPALYLILNAVTWNACENIQTTIPNDGDTSMQVDYYVRLQLPKMRLSIIGAR